MAVMAATLAAPPDSHGTRAGDAAAGRLDAPGAGSHDAAVRSVLRVTGELLVTAGVVVLLFAGWLVVGTGWETAREQDAATDQLRERWAAAPVTAPAAVGETAPVAEAGPAPAGEPVLRLEVPRFGRAFTVLEGTAPDVLARGPGRYAGSAAPGEPGNLAVAGHRVTRGAPFDAAATLQACDPLVVETADTWWVYRVLPVGSVDGPVCGVDLPPAYAALPGLRVVAPGDRDVLAPVPGRPDDAPSAALLTLTTCHPRFSARERLVVHAVLARAQPKADGRPAELGSP
jgi:sortase (surface protein transpeptidase)